jgi:hypothetical protein
MSFSLVVLLTVFGILAVADNIFSWDILTESMEDVALLLMSATGIIVVATFLISLMVNFSLISISMEKIADKLDKKSMNNE